MAEVILSPISLQHHLIALLGRYFVHKFPNSKFLDFIRSISDFSEQTFRVNTYELSLYLHAQSQQ